MSRKGYIKQSKGEAFLFTYNSLIDPMTLEVEAGREERAKTRHTILFPCALALIAEPVGAATIDQSHSETSSTTIQ